MDCSDKSSKSESLQEQILKDRDTSVLTECERQLLCRYFDDEVGVIERSRAERLLSRNQHAGEYLASLDDLRRNVSSALQEQCSTVDLWSKVAARIDLEERAAVFTGKRGSDYRAESDKREGWIQKFLPPSWAYGFSAGAVSALATLLVVGPLSSGSLAPSLLAPSLMTAGAGAPTVEQNQREISRSMLERSLSDRAVSNASNAVSHQAPSQQLASSQGSARSEFFRPAQLGVVDRSTQSGQRQLTAFDIQGTDFDLSPAERRSHNEMVRTRVDSGLVDQGLRPASIEPVVNSGAAVSMASNTSQVHATGALELDWVRSDGRVRVLRDERAQNPIIFVRRRPQLSASGSQLFGMPLNSMSAINPASQEIISSTMR